MAWAREGSMMIHFVWRSVMIHRLHKPLIPMTSYTISVFILSSRAHLPWKNKEINGFVFRLCSPCKFIKCRMLSFEDPVAECSSPSVRWLPVVCVCSCAPAMGFSAAGRLSAASQPSEWKHYQSVPNNSCFWQVSVWRLMLYNCQ